MGYFYVYRNTVFGLCLLLTIPNLGLTAHWTQGTEQLDTVLGFEGMGIFISCLSILAFPILLLLPEFRKNAFISYIISEILIILFMWIMWMTAAILVIEEKELLYPLNTCSIGLFADAVHWCNEMFAIQGLSVTIFVLLLKYLLILMIFAFVNHSRGLYVWKSSVKDLQLKTPNIKMTHTSQADIEGKTDASVFGAAGYPPPQQVSYAQPTYAQPTYSNSSTHLAMQSNSPGQVNQSVSYSQYGAGNTPAPQMQTPAQNSYTQFPPPPSMGSALPEV